MDKNNESKRARIATNDNDTEQIKMAKNVYVSFLSPFSTFHFVSNRLTVIPILFHCFIPHIFRLFVPLFSFVWPTIFRSCFSCLSNVALTESTMQCVIYANLTEWRRIMTLCHYAALFSNFILLRFIFGSFFFATFVCLQRPLSCSDARLVVVVNSLLAVYVSLSFAVSFVEQCSLVLFTYYSLNFIEILFWTSSMFAFSRFLLFFSMKFSSSFSVFFFCFLPLLFLWTLTASNDATKKMENTK